MNNIRKSEINGLVSDLKKRFDLHGKKITKNDFERICQTENIEFWQMPFTPKGCYGDFKGMKFIILDHKMSNKKFMFVGFHELGHHFLKHKNKKDKKAEALKLEKEKEADYFSKLFTSIPVHRTSSGTGI